MDNELAESIMDDLTYFPDVMRKSPLAPTDFRFTGYGSSAI